ncbi:MAG TPA: glycosyltransferase [Candidatus Latescibacteria bacterium]|nr:glycosyltransferase [Candidatus Latescibacterota bacterium]
MYEIVQKDLLRWRQRRHEGERILGTCAVLFVKSPACGSVKTRLRSHLSDDERVALYTAFLVDSAETLAASAAELKVIAYSPDTAATEIRGLVGERAAGIRFVPQPLTDLGGRMAGMVEWSFQQGARRTVLVGSDSPSLPAAYIDRGLELLRERDLVLGPSTDGGYYLIGQSRGRGEERAVFTGIDWSTGRVFEQTLAAAASSSLGLLPPWYDVDTPSDAAFLKVHLEAMRRVGGRDGANSLRILRTLDLPPPS